MGNQQINKWQNIKKKGMFLFILNNWIYFFYAVIKTIGSVIIVLCLSLSNVFDKITTDYLLYIFFPAFFITYMAGASIKILMKWKRLKYK